MKNKNRVSVDSAPSKTNSFIEEEKKSKAENNKYDELKRVKLITKTNFHGGTLGGISSGMPIHFRVAIKPVSTIAKQQRTVTYEGVETVLEAHGRHDPCVLPRAPAIIESMSALVVGDQILIQEARKTSII